jgi:peptide/nickel transport system permease protein
MEVARPQRDESSGSCLFTRGDNIYRYVAWRTALAVLTLLLVSMLVFVITRVTGDPTRFVLGELATEEAVAEFRAEYGLDRPIVAQYASFIAGLFHGHLGSSVRYKEPVERLFLERVPATLALGATAFFLAVVVGVGVGVYSAYRAGSVPDKLARVAVLAGQAVPGFYLGILLIILVAVRLRWFPTGGYDGLRSLVLPALTLSAYLTAVVLRFTRSAMLDVLHNQYIATARAKGLSERAVVLRHALRNVLIPIVTVLGVQSRILLTGAVVTETVFSWPGLGRLTVEAIKTRDFPVIQGSVFIMTVAVVVLNLLIDILYSVLDPRVRLE